MSEWTVWCDNLSVPIATNLTYNEMTTKVLENTNHYYGIDDDGEMWEHGDEES